MKNRYRALVASILRRVVEDIASREESILNRRERRGEEGAEVVDEGYEPTVESVRVAFNPHEGVFGVVDDKRLGELDESEKLKLVRALQGVSPDELKRWLREYPAMVYRYPERVDDVKMMGVFVRRALPRAQNFR